MAHLLLSASLSLSLSLSFSMARLFSSSSWSTPSNRTRDDLENLEHSPFFHRKNVLNTFGASTLLGYWLFSSRLCGSLTMRNNVQRCLTLCAHFSLISLSILHSFRFPCNQGSCPQNCPFRRHFHFLYTFHETRSRDPVAVCLLFPKTVTHTGNPLCTRRFRPFCVRISRLFRVTLSLRFRSVSLSILLTLPRTHLAATFATRQNNLQASRIATQTFFLPVSTPKSPFSKANFVRASSIVNLEAFPPEGETRSSTSIAVRDAVC